MKTWILLTLTVIITSSAVLSGTTFLTPEIFEAFAGISLDPDNAANSIVVHTSRVGTSEERTYDSFSRIGFVSGEGNFLLESVPSLDKKDFYEFLKESLDNNNQFNEVEMDVSIDIYSGNGKLIETLEYNKCTLEEYFVHSVDSLGKIQFIEGKDSIEIREVTKLGCKSFSINLDKFGTELNEEIIVEKEPSINNEGDLKFNLRTNTVQIYQNGEWVDYSNKDGSEIQR